jgi:hypothetical protein
MSYAANRDSIVAIAEHAFFVLLGFGLMVLGLGLGVTMVMLPFGIVIGLLGIAMLVGGLFAEMTDH